MIKPGDTVSLARVGLKPEYKSGPGTNLDTTVTLHTNLTSVTVPLVLFNGNLKTVSSNNFFYPMNRVSVYFYLQAAANLLNVVLRNFYTFVLID